MDDKAKEEHARATLKGFVENMPSMQRAIESPDRIDEFFERLQVDNVAWRGLRIQLEVYESSPGDPVLIFHGGIGTFARFYMPFLAMLSENGFNVIAVERPGHGFSDGRKGDCTVEDLRDFMPLVVELATKRFNDRIGMFGSSLGGITTFYLLPDLVGIRSAICHCCLYPGEIPDPRKHLLSAVSRFVGRIAPRLPVPMSLLMDEKLVNAVSESPYLVQYVADYRKDPLLCHHLTLRSAVSFFGGYAPKRSYSDVAIPVLGLFGEVDRLIPASRNKVWWEKAALPNGEVHVMPGASHSIFHDNIPESLEVVGDWFRRTLAESPDG